MGIRALLEQAEHIQIVAEADVLGACASAHVHRLDAIILESSFPMETARAAACILAKLDRTAVVFLGPSPASLWLAARVNSGRSLILDHGVSLDGMVAAIYGSVDEAAALETGNSDDSSLTSDDLLRHNGGRQEDRLETLLSAREWEVLSLIAVGHSDKEIARELVLSQHTVKGHVRNVLRKLQVPNRTAAAAVFVALVPPAAPRFMPR